LAVKTTLDLPDTLVKEVELCASDEGRNLNDVAADLLRIGLANRPAAPAPQSLPLLKTHPITNLPYFECTPDAPASRMTPRQLIELENDTQSEEDLGRLGLSPRQ
jgi:hypothetical protein